MASGRRWCSSSPERAAWVAWVYGGVRTRGGGTQRQNAGAHNGSVQHASRNARAGGASRCCANSHCASSTARERGNCCGGIARAQP